MTADMKGIIVNNDNFAKSHKAELKSSQLKLSAIKINSIQAMEDHEDDEDENPRTPIVQQTDEVRISVEIGNILNDVSSISNYVGGQETPSVQQSRLTNENMMDTMNQQNNMTRVQLNRLLKTPEINDVADVAQIADTRLKSEARDRPNATMVNKKVLINNMMNDEQLNQSMQKLVKVRDSHEVPLTQQNEANVSNNQH